MVFLNYFLLLFLFVPSTKTDSFYVSPTGSTNWPNCLTITNPCSLHTANLNVQPNDIIFLLPGEYDTGIIPSSSGTNVHQLITYQSYDSSKEVLFGSYVSRGIIIDQKSYIKVQGVHIYNVRNQWVVISNSDHIYLVDIICDGVHMDIAYGTFRVKRLKPKKEIIHK